MLGQLQKQLEELESHVFYRRDEYQNPYDYSHYLELERERLESMIDLVKRDNPGIVLLSPFPMLLFYTSFSFPFPFSMLLFYASFPFPFILLLHKDMYLILLPTLTFTSTPSSTLLLLSFHDYAVPKL